MPKKAQNRPLRENAPKVDLTLAPEVAQGATRYNSETARRVASIALTFSPRRPRLLELRPKTGAPEAARIAPPRGGGGLERFSQGATGAPTEENLY